MMTGQAFSVRPTSSSTKEDITKQQKLAIMLSMLQCISKRQDPKIFSSKQDVDWRYTTSASTINDSRRKIVSDYLKDFKKILSME